MTSESDGAARWPVFGCHGSRGPLVLAKCHDLGKMASSGAAWASCEQEDHNSVSSAWGTAQFWGCWWWGRHSFGRVQGRPWQADSCEVRAAITRRRLPGAWGPAQLPWAWGLQPATLLGRPCPLCALGDAAATGWRGPVSCGDMAAAGWQREPFCAAFLGTPLCHCGCAQAPSAILWRQLHWHPFTGVTVGLRFFSFFFSFYVHIMCVCVKVVFWKTSLFIDDVIVIVLFFWLINCLLSLLCMPAKISHTSSWKGYEETSNWNHNHLIMRAIWKIIFQPKTCLISKSGFY